jgi:hypothetical protein
MRGSLVNVTMRNMTAQQRQQVRDLVDRILKHPEMQDKKGRIIHKLATTIKADYRDDRSIAEQEFICAVWRFAVDLLAHHRYKFFCVACQSFHRLTKRGKPTPLNRQTIPCENCDKLEVVDPGEIDPETGLPYSGLVAGSHVTMDEFQDSYKKFPKEWKPPTNITTVQYVSVNKKYTAAQIKQILSSNKQLVKMASEFVSNLGRQILAENKRLEHKQKVQPIRERADIVIAKEYVSLCEKDQVEHTFHPSPFDRCLFIRFPVYLTTPQFAVSCSLLRQRAAQHGIDVCMAADGIRIIKDENAPTIEGSVTEREHVMFQEDTGEEGTDKQQLLQNVCHRTIGGMNLDPEDHVALVDFLDTVEVVSEALPDGDCRKVFHIKIHSGDDWREFAKDYGPGEAKKSHIAAHLGITPNAVTRYMEVIQATCLFYSCHPPKLC